MENNKKLTRSSNKMFAGVCAGIAEYLGWETSVVRTHMSFSVYSQHLQVYWFTSSYGLSCLIKDTKKASDGLGKPAFR